MLDDAPGPAHVYAAEVCVPERPALTGTAFVPPPAWLPGIAELYGRRVCFIAGTLGQGGAERQLYYILAALQEHGARPRVLCLTAGEFWEARIRALGVPVQYVGASASRLRRLVRIIANLRAEPADVVQSQHFYTNLYATAASRVLGVPEIGALRSDVFNEVAANPGWLGTASLRAPRLLAANSTRAIDNAVARGVPRARLRLLPNVVDATQFAAPSDGGRDCDAAGPVRLLLVGRLSAEKRGDRFLRIVTEARRQLGGAVEGMIVGDGPERVVLEREAAALGLLHGLLHGGVPGAPGVTFHGAQADVTPWYRRASVLVLTSDFEGTPNVVLEAMASALPVVATNVGGVPDLVRDGVTGFVVPRDDEAALTRVVLTLASDADLRRRFGAAGRRHIEAHYALPRLADELRALYAAALAPTTRERRGGQA